MTKFFGRIDTKTGQLMSSYSTESHLKNDIPKEAAEMTLEERDALLAGDRMFDGKLIGPAPDLNHVIESGKWVLDPALLIASKQASTVGSKRIFMLNILPRNRRKM